MNNSLHFFSEEPVQICFQKVEAFFKPLVLFSEIDSYIDNSIHYNFAPMNLGTVKILAIELTDFAY